MSNGIFGGGCGLGLVAGARPGGAVSFAPSYTARPGGAVSFAPSYLARPSAAVYRPDIGKIAQQVGFDWQARMGEPPGPGYAAEWVQKISQLMGLTYEQNSPWQSAYRARLRSILMTKPLAERYATAQQFKSLVMSAIFDLDPFNYNYASGGWKRLMGLNKQDDPDPAAALVQNLVDQGFPAGKVYQRTVHLYVAKLVDDALTGANTLTFMQTPSGTSGFGALGAQPDAVTTAVAVLSTVSMAASAYHGYKRNDSVGWALWWGFCGAMFPVITPVIALAQGFGKPAGGR